MKKTLVIVPFICLLPACTSLDLWWEGAAPPPDGIPIYADSVFKAPEIYTQEALCEEVINRFYSEWIAVQPRKPRLMTSIRTSYHPEDRLPKQILRDLARDHLIFYSDEDTRHALLFSAKVMNLTEPTPKESRFDIQFSLIDPKNNAAIWISPLYPSFSKKK